MEEKKFFTDIPDEENDELDINSEDDFEVSENEDYNTNQESIENNYQEKSFTQKRIEKRQEEKNKLIGDKKARESNSKKPNTNPYNKERQKQNSPLANNTEEKKTPSTLQKPLEKKKDNKSILDKAKDKKKSKLSIKELIKKKLKEHLPLIIICSPLIIAVFIGIFIIMFMSLFGGDLSPDGFYDYETGSNISGGIDDRPVHLTYDDGTNKMYDESYYVAGVLYAFLKDNIETYKSENFNIAEMYYVLGANIAYSIFDGYDYVNYDDDDDMPTTDDPREIKYSTNNFCSIEGCYEITDEDGNTFYVDEELSKNYPQEQITNTIPALSEEDSTLILDKASEGIAWAAVTYYFFTNAAVLNEDMKTAVHDYINDGKEIEYIIDHLGISFMPFTDEDVDDSEDDDEDASDDSDDE